VDFTAACAFFSAAQYFRILSMRALMLMQIRGAILVDEMQGALDREENATIVVLGVTSLHLTNNKNSC
jgi:hypothetical protein